MREFHQGPKEKTFNERPDIWLQLFLHVHNDFALAKRGGPYMKKVKGFSGAVFSDADKVWSESLRLCHPGSERN